MRKMFAVLILSACSAAGAQITPITVPLGTRVMLATTTDLTSRSNVKGDIVPLRVDEDVAIDGRRVIARGAAAVGQIIDARAKGAMGMSGRLVLRPLYLRVGERVIRLSGQSVDKASVTAGAVLGSVAIGPVFTGRSASIPSGTRLSAVVEKTVQLPPLD